MRITTFGDLELGEAFKTNKITNHASDITVWRKLNDEYKYTSVDAVYDNNAKSLYCYTAFMKHDIIQSLDENESKEQEEIYKHWCVKFVSKAALEKL